MYWCERNILLLERMHWLCKRKLELWNIFDDNFQHRVSGPCYCCQRQSSHQYRRLITECTRHLDWIRALALPFKVNDIISNFSDIDVNWIYIDTFEVWVLPGISLFQSHRSKKCVTWRMIKRYAWNLRH